MAPALEWLLLQAAHLQRLSMPLTAKPESQCDPGTTGAPGPDPLLGLRRPTLPQPSNTKWLKHCAAVTVYSASMLCSQVSPIRRLCLRGSQSQVCELPSPTIPQQACHRARPTSALRALIIDCQFPHTHSYPCSTSLLDSHNPIFVVYNYIPFVLTSSCSIAVKVLNELSLAFIM